MTAKPSRAARSHGGGTRQPRPGSAGHRRSQGGLFTRATLFFAVLALTVGAAAFLLWPRGGAALAADQTIQATMDGYSEKLVTARAGEPFRLLVVNPDSSFHTDGNGWHQVAIPALGIDARIPPRSQRVVEITATEPGEYEFYCDICCGGKENPTMRGTLKVVPA